MAWHNDADTLPAPSPSYSNWPSTLWEHGSESPVPNFEPCDVLIAVMGMTGAGKSSSISLVTTANVKVGHGLSSCTKKIGTATMRLGNRRIHVIDTLGFDDTELTDGDILEVIALYLSNPKGPPVRITGSIYLHRISDVRVSGSSLNNIKLFRGLVGSRSMQNVLLVSNMWGQVTELQGEKREKELLATDDFWGSMMRFGAKCDRFNNTHKDGLRLVDKLLPNEPVPLQLQVKMQKGVPISNTTAGKQINAQLERLNAEYEDKLGDLKIELEQARQESDREKEELIRQEQKRAEDRLQAAQSASDKLYASKILELQEQVNRLAKSGCAVM